MAGELRECPQCGNFVEFSFGHCTICEYEPVINFIQIIYEEDQRQHCYPFATVYKNEDLTPFFENGIISNIAPSIGGDRISISSWRLAAKRNDMYQLRDKTLSISKISDADFDIAVLTPRSPQHQMLTMASHWHGNSWDKSFEVFKNMLRSEFGIKVPEELSHPIYENHFIARREIYHDYVNNLLRPVIELMRGNKIFMLPAGYLRRKKPEDQAKILPILESWGMKDYPIAPFILERLFSIYCEGKGFKIINL